jgi:formylglycine-generating enzyme required for sulfatase activity
MQTPNGVVRVEIDDPKIKLAIEGHSAFITNADKQPITLKPGIHGLTITRGDFTFDTTTFQLKKGDKTTLRIDWLEGKRMVVAQDGRKIGEKEADYYALAFDGQKSYVDFPTLKREDGVPLTLEAWVRPHRTDPARSKVLAPFGGVVFVMERAEGTEQLDADQVNNQWLAVRSDFGTWLQHPLQIGKTVHLAYVCDKQEIRFFLDGKLVRRSGRGKDLTPGSGRLPWAAMGGYGKVATTFPGAFAGVIGETRVSKVARYDKNFTPDKRFESDADTLALYHFDEGQGDVLKDSSGNRHHGKIVGAKWIKAEGADPPAAQLPAPSPLDAKQARALQEAWASHLGVDVEIENSLGMKFRLIPPGEFMMGTPQAVIDAYVAKAEAAEQPGYVTHFLKLEAPPRLLSIEEPYYFGVHEVTQKAWRTVMESNSSANRDSLDLPVENITWLEALTFCNRLSELEKRHPCYRIDGDKVEWLGGDGYRLPLAEEWEYACRAGSTTKYFFGDDPAPLGDYAWFAGNSSGHTQPVGRKRANPFGLYDMVGNVWELVQHTKTLTMGKFNRCRGGDYSGQPKDLRSAVISNIRRDVRSIWVGIRVVRPVSRDR